MFWTIDSIYVLEYFIIIWALFRYFITFLLNSSWPGDVFYMAVKVFVKIFVKMDMLCIICIPNWSLCVDGYASVTSNHRALTILAPVRFLACKAEWGAHRNFTPVLFSWSHQTTGPVRPDTAVHLWFAGLHMDPVRCTCGRRAGPALESPMFFIPQGYATPLRTQPEFAKIPHWRMWQYRALTVPARDFHWLFTSSKPIRDP